MNERPDPTDTEQTGGGRADADQAFLFAETGTTRCAITRNPMKLPPSDKGWKLVQSFTLGVQHVVPINVEPEPVIRAIDADGYCVWDENRLPEPKGTGQ